MAYNSSGLSRVVEEARRRRDEAASNFERVRQVARQEPRPESLPQRPQQPQRISPPVQTRQEAPRITRTENPPPLPPTIPPATPVGQLKAQTADRWNFSPRAREELYDTPTLVKYQSYDRLQEKGEPSGYYRFPGYDRDTSGPHQIMVYEPEGRRPHTTYSNVGETTWPSVGAGVLAHEFGHRWNHEFMPDYLQQDWSDGGWLDAPVWTPETGEKFRHDFETGTMDIGSWQTLGGEAYANTVMQSQTPGMEIPPEFRDKYFAGLFNDSVTRWMPPFVPQETRQRPPISDILRERDPRFMGPDENGNWG